MPACWVYVLQSETSGRYYVGSSEDLQERLEYHNAGRVDSTRAYRPWQLVYQAEYPSRSEALQREREIKAKKSRRWIEFHLLGKVET